MPFSPRGVKDYFHLIGLAIVDWKSGQSCGVGYDLSELVDAEHIQCELFIECFAGAAPHLVKEVYSKESNCAIV